VGREKKVDGGRSNSSFKENMRTMEQKVRRKKREIRPWKVRRDGIIHQFDVW
jgi:hypothetical protein